MKKLVVKTGINRIKERLVTQRDVLFYKQIFLKYHEVLTLLNQDTIEH
jgi:hypothetical protein